MNKASKPGAETGGTRSLDRTGLRGTSANRHRQSASAANGAAHLRYRVKRRGGVGVGVVGVTGDKRQAARLGHQRTAYSNLLKG